MKTYRILMNETIAYSITIEAESEDDARDRLHEGEGSHPYGEWTVETFIVDIEEQND